MIRGIRFHIPNEWGSLLPLVFDGIAIENYFWRIFDNDTYHHVANIKDKGIFEREAYHGLEFKKIIEQPRYYVITLGLLALPEETDEEVYDYESFLNSSAKFFVQIGDCELVSVFTKDEETIEVFRAIAERHSFKNIELITKENDYYKRGWK